MIDKMYYSFGNSFGELKYLNPLFELFDYFLTIFYIFSGLIILTSFILTS